MKIKVDNNRISCMLDDLEIGYIDFLVNEFLDALYIYVEPDYRNTNAKDLLLDELIKMSDEMNLKINAVCGYMNKWFNKYKPEYLK